MRFYSICALALLVTGCASVTGNKLQPVSVQAIDSQGNTEVAGAGCTLMNDVGKWFVTTPGSVMIHKSTDDLTVECKKDEHMVGHQNVVSKANGGVWGNIILGGGVGYIVDRNTGAGFDYPTVITVVMNKIGNAIGFAPSEPTSQPVVAGTEHPAPALVKASTEPTTD